MDIKHANTRQLLVLALGAAAAIHAVGGGTSRAWAQEPAPVESAVPSAQAPAASAPVPGQSPPAVSALPSAELSAVPSVPVPGAMPSTPIPAPADSSRRLTVPVMVTGGAAALGLAIGVGFAIHAMTKKSDYDSHPSAHTADQGERSAVIADLAFGSAVLLGITSAALYYLRDDSVQRAQPTSAQARPRRSSWVAAGSLLPQGASVGAALQF